VIPVAAGRRVEEGACGLNAGARAGREGGKALGDCAGTGGAGGYWSCVGGRAGWGEGWGTRLAMRARIGRRGRGRGWAEASGGRRGEALLDGLVEALLVLRRQLPVAERLPQAVDRGGHIAGAAHRRAAVGFRALFHGDAKRAGAAMIKAIADIERLFGRIHAGAVAGIGRMQRLDRQRQLGAARVDMKDPKRAIGREDDIRVDAQILTDSVAANAPIHVVYQIENLTSHFIAVADRVLMLEHAIFTVASPEAAAAILWRDAARAPEAAQNMKITAQDLYNLRLVDEIVAEPVGGAHRDHPAAARAVSDAVVRTLEELERLSIDDLLAERRGKPLGHDPTHGVDAAAGRSRLARPRAS